MYKKKNKPLKDNSLAECIRSGLKDVVSDNLISGSLITKGSPGQGSWATVPWIGADIQMKCISAECPVPFQRM
ncbi:MrcB family domain-containing protein, partial [uncultured Leuconostoc sp.]|uniref:MrcB family domain-containing protein n=1 Tax=uncultured Leuconostoc sp. TaxID=173262 RepID=UPI00338FB725